MNNQKDIQRYGLMERKRSNGNVTVSDRNDLRSVAVSDGMEAFGLVLSKKCERLATATYLITNFLSDTEPLKSRLRTLSLDFVRDASFVRYGGSATENTFFDALRANINEALSLFELAFIAGLVSEMNFTILKREYVSLRDAIDIKKASRESRTDSILGGDFFGSPSSSVGNTQDSKSTLINSSPSSKFKNISDTHRGIHQSVAPNMSDRKNEEKIVAPALSPEIKSYPAQKTPKGQTQKEEQTSLLVSVSKESRRNRILKLIKDNREVAIKDIVSHFPDLSGKTIQRELISLSDSGVLKKTGERRWSRYSIA